jgi:ABC-type transport system substrate-binding protein
MLGKIGGLNWGGFSSAGVDDLLVQLRGELDPARRQALSRQIQTLAGDVIPDVSLAVAPIVSAYGSATVLDFTPHPDDTYLIGTRLAVA